MLLGVADSNSPAQDPGPQGRCVCGQKVTISGDNNSAHSDGEPTPSCQDSYGKTVWYQLVPEANGTITASTAGSTISGGDVFDTVLAAYEGTSSSLTERACNDDTGDTTSRISFSVSGGQKYYLQLGGYDSGDGGAHGTFQLCIALNNDAACSGPAEPTAVANQVIPTSTTGPTETPTPDWTATPTSASGTDTPTPIGTIAGTGTGTTTGTGNVTGSKSGTPIAQTAAGPGRAGAAGTGTGRGTAGAAGPGGSGAPGDVSLAPTQSVVWN